MQSHVKLVIPRDHYTSMTEIPRDAIFKVHRHVTDQPKEQDNGVFILGKDINAVGGIIDDHGLESEYFFSKRFVRNPS